MLDRIEVAPGGRAVVEHRAEQPLRDRLRTAQVMDALGETRGKASTGTLPPTAMRAPRAGSIPRCEHPYVGGSQVTSVVREDRTIAQHGARYERGFTARLVFPYLVRLTISSVISSHELQSRDAFSALLDMRRSPFG